MKSNSFIGITGLDKGENPKTDINKLKRSLILYVQITWDQMELNCNIPRHT